MTWWAVGAAVVSAAASAYSSNQASNAQRDAANQSNGTQLSMYDQTRADNMPALNARNAALARLQDLLGLSGNITASGYGSLAGPITVGDVTKDPGYQFGMTQGMQALNNQNAARGMRNSGAALLAADRYATDYASTKYNDAFNREVANRNAILNPLQVSAQLAQSGANSIAASGSNAANNISQTQASLGNALAANQLLYGQQLSNTANQLGGWYTYQQRNPSGDGSAADAWRAQNGQG